MLNRRHFFRSSSVAAMAAVAMPSLLQARQTQTPDSDFGTYPETRKLSILSYSFSKLVNRGMQDIFGYFETCKYRYNLHAADLWMGHFLGFKDVYAGKYAPYDETYTDKVKEALDERELFIPNFTADGCHITDFDPDRQEVNYKNALEHLKLAKKLGVGFVRFDTGPAFRMPDGREDWTNEEFDLLVKRYREYAQYAYDHGYHFSHFQ